MAPPEVVPAIWPAGSAASWAGCGGCMTEKTCPGVEADGDDTTEAGGWGENVKVGSEVMGAAEYTTCC